MVGLAYFAGKQDWFDLGGGETESSTNPRKANQAIDFLRSQLPSVTKDEAIAKILDLLAGNWPPTEKPSSRGFVIRHMFRDGTINFKDIPDIIAAIHDAPPSPDRETIMFELISLLAGNASPSAPSDPMAALKLLDELKDPTMRQQVAGMAIAKEIQTDPQQALGALGQLAPGTLSSQVYSSLLRSSLGFLAQSDPGQALTILEQLPSGTTSTEVYSSVFMGWANQNFSEALAAAQALAPGSAHDEALLGVVLSKINTDPQGALNWLLDLPPENLKSFVGILPSLENANPQVVKASLDKLMSIPDPAMHSQLINWYTQTLSKDNPSAAISWLGTVTSGDTYNTAVAGLINTLSVPDHGYTKDASGETDEYTNSKNLQAVANLLGNVTDPAARAVAITTLANNWSLTDPKAALTWATSLPSSDAATRASVLNTIVSAWAKTDPASALAYMQNSDNPAGFLSSAPAIAQSLGAADAQSAFAFVQGLPDGTIKDQALNSALASIAKSDVTGALTYASNLQDGPNRDSAVGGIVNMVARKDPAQAAALLGQIPMGTAQLNATTVVASIWVSKDPPTFLDWLGGLPEGDVRDAAIVQLDSSGQAAKHPSTVFAQANSISNPDLRAVQIQTVLTNWAVKDPQAALAAAQNANLPDEQRTSLVQLLTKRN